MSAGKIGRAGLPGGSVNIRMFSRLAEKHLKQLKLTSTDCTAPAAERL